MILVTYRIRIINSNGSVTDGGSTTFLDSVSVKQATKSVAEGLQRAESNVILTESHRESV